MQAAGMVIIGVEFWGSDEKPVLASLIRSCLAFRVATAPQNYEKSPWNWPPGVLDGAKNRILTLFFHSE